MSLQTFLTTVETDIKDAVTWVEGETETALTAIWSACKPIFIAFEPTVVHAVLQEIVSFLGSAAPDVKAGGASYIAETFMATLRDTGHVLLADAETLGTDLLTVLAGLAKTSAAAAPPPAA